MCDSQITRLRADIARLGQIARVRAEGDEELRELLLIKAELNHYERVKAARKEVQAKLEGLVEANKQVVEAIRNKEREEDALNEFSRARVRAGVLTKRERSEDSAAPETKTKRKRASD